MFNNKELMKLNETIYLSFYDVYGKIMKINRRGIWILPEQTSENYPDKIAANKICFINNNNLY